jgi:hypothetical protein
MKEEEGDIDVTGGGGRLEEKEFTHLVLFY